MVNTVIVVLSLSFSAAAFGDVRNSDQGVDVNLKEVSDEVTWVEDTVSEDALLPDYRERPPSSVEDSPLTGAIVSRVSPQEHASLTTTRRPTASDYDPFSTLLRWEWDATVSVGEGIQRLVKVAGYALTIRDPNVATVYSMPLPYAHRNVRGIDVKTGLEFLGGPGLMLVVDHANRTIMHVVRSEYSSSYDLASLPRCPNVSFALMPAGSAADRVLIIGGEQCAY